ncbi:MAG: ComF family protein [Phocaeicola sp.]
MSATFWIECWELFFPRQCAICQNKLLASEKHICLSCLIHLPRTPLLWSDGNELEKELWGKIPLVKAASYLHYDKGGDARKLLYELKYYQNPTIGEWLGRCMAQELMPLNFFDSIDFLIPVPLHIKKEQKRGYNQSLMIAQGVSSVTKIPILSNSIYRNRFNETQTNKGLYERWINVQELFKLHPQSYLESKHILLIDDVFTTGATIVACADALSHLPDIRISVLTLASAK